MKKVLFMVVMASLMGCGSAVDEAPKEEKKRVARPIPVARVKPVPAKVEKQKPGEPEPPPPYTFGDLVFALQEDAKARSSAGRIDGVDPRIFKPDIRHERIRVVIAEHYKAEITLQSVLKLRDDLCKENQLTPEQVNAVKLDEIAEVFEKIPKQQ